MADEQYYNEQFTKVLNEAGYNGKAYLHPARPPVLRLMLQEADYKKILNDNTEREALIRKLKPESINIFITIDLESIINE